MYVRRNSPKQRLSPIGESRARTEKLHAEENPTENPTKEAKKAITRDNSPSLSPMQNIQEGEALKEHKNLSGEEGPFENPDEETQTEEVSMPRDQQLSDLAKELEQRVEINKETTSEVTLEITSLPQIGEHVDIPHLEEGPAAKGGEEREQQNQEKDEENIEVVDESPPHD